MPWIWENKDWPHFKYDVRLFIDKEQQFREQAGILTGALIHVDTTNSDEFKINLLSDEAVHTSAIEGDILDRASVQSSVRRGFGLITPLRSHKPAEHGIAELMVDLYKTYADPLDHATLFRWHKMITAGRRDLTDIGQYRTHTDPMQIVSGAVYAPDIHYEAPPSSIIASEMNTFINWFNQTGHDRSITPLIRAGITHLYFECIHPFEDGNGRIGRALVEKSLSSDLGRPALVSLARVIERHKKSYYKALQDHSYDLDITSWLDYFSDTILTAQQDTQHNVTFIIAKTRFYDRLRGQMNPRQEKVIARMFAEGIDGFKGGLSAENYIRITGAPRTTTTRDLQDLVEKKALTKTGSGRYTRYALYLKG